MSLSLLNLQKNPSSRERWSYAGRPGCAITRSAFCEIFHTPCHANQRCSMAERVPW